MEASEQQQQQLQDAEHRLVRERDSQGISGNVADLAV